MTTFFIGDTHFGHKNIIKFEQCHRSFSTIEEHDEELVRRWNSRVNPKDTVWHLGDFCFGKNTLEIASRLNGNKKLVMGNHDMYSSSEYLKYFTRVAGAIEYKGMILTHIPVREEQLERFTHNIHGHLHANKLNDPRYINVSAEQIDLTPISWEEIKLLATTQTQ